MFSLAVTPGIVQVLVWNPTLSEFAGVEAPLFVTVGIGYT